ncbi:MAG: hypothetical protein WKF73_02290 [Nocardioidaceae bacterium]
MTAASSTGSTRAPRSSGPVVSGMVLVNPTPNTPRRRLPRGADGAPRRGQTAPRSRQYVESAGASRPVRLWTPTRSRTSRDPQIAGFSSRGPLIAGDGDILKPDLSAPGVSVIAAVAPPFNSGQQVGHLLRYVDVGSARHRARGVHQATSVRDWTPAMIKSAMMTTAYDLKKATTARSRKVLATSTRAKFLDPGLVYDARLRGVAELPDRRSKPARQLNQASIAIGDAHRQTPAWSARSPTCPTQAETYTADSAGPATASTSRSPRHRSCSPTWS